LGKNPDVRGIGCWPDRKLMLEILAWATQNKTSLIQHFSKVAGEQQMSKHYLSMIQMYSLAGQMQDFAKEVDVEWETVCPEIIQLVKSKDDGTVVMGELEEACRELIRKKKGQR
jgi:hypothetical protein